MCPSQKSNSDTEEIFKKHDVVEKTLNEKDATPQKDLDEKDVARAVLLEAAQSDFLETAQVATHEQDRR